MKKLLIVLPLTILVMLFLALFVGADLDPGLDDAGNLNDPTVNERANACYTGYFDDRIAG